MDTNSKIDNVIFFDGVCNLCNSSVNFVIDRDPKGLFKFATLQSSFAKELLERESINSLALESIVFYSDNRLYKRSRAALEIARKMSGGWPLFYALIIVPRFLRDSIYNLVATKRYKWFGRTDSCRIPTRELESRFVDS
jgi:predicted DCC family thiol-disulfide oxidoreductase YuxK